MTLAELKLIKELLAFNNIKFHKNYEAVVALVNRDIRVKELDPRSSPIEQTSEPTCICSRLGGHIAVSNPACPRHGIAQQLNRSQME